MRHVRRSAEEDRRLTLIASRKSGDSGGNPHNNQIQEPRDMNREELLSGTRPQITGGRVVLTGADGFDGYEIMAYMGMVWGISVRAKDMGQDCAMGCKHLTGGELQSYTVLGDESRQQAIDRMISMAARQEANGIINVNFELAGANQGATQVVVHGTAVVIKPIIQYVPVGAAGNILADIHDEIKKRSSP